VALPALLVVSMTRVPVSEIFNVSSSPLSSVDTAVPQVSSRARSHEPHAHATAESRIVADKSIDIEIW